jgi:hypothetical protein
METSKAIRERESKYEAEVARCRKEHGRRVPPKPVRGDGDGKPWRPGDAR